MHHIKNDSRCLKTVTLIYVAVAKLLKTKKIEDISVTEICKMSSVSRSTFYRNFDTPMDVLMLKCEMEHLEVFESYREKCLREKTEYNNSAFLRHYFNCFKKHKPATEMLLKSGKLNITYDVGVRMAKKMSQEFFIPHLSDPEDYEYFISIRAGLLTSLLTLWIQNGKKKTVDELMAILKLSGSLGSGREIYRSGDN